MEERDEIDLANLSYFLDSSSGDDDDGITDNRQQKGLMEKKIAEVTKLQIETKLSYSATSSPENYEQNAKYVDPTPN